MKKKKLIAMITGAWIIISIVASLGGYGFSFFGYVQDNYFSPKSKAKVLGSTWIAPVIKSSTFTMFATPFFGYVKKGPPYSLGVNVVDYENKKGFKKLELINLKIINQGLTKTIVSESNSISSDFKTYVPRVEHVRAECLFMIKNENFIDYEKPIQIKAVFLLHKKNSFQKETIEAKFLPSSWKGFWRIWDVLSA